MQYRDISSEDDIPALIEELRVRHKNLSQITPAGEYQSTMGGRKVLTLYVRLEPALKIEGEQELIDTFVARLTEEAKGYSRK